MLCHSIASHMCNQSKRWARHHGRGDVMTKRLKSTWGATGISFCHSAKLCVCVSHDLWSVSLIYCCLSCYKSSNIESSHMSKLRQRQRNTRAKADHITDCVIPPFPHYIKRTGIHAVCAWSDWEWRMQSLLSRGPTAHIVSGFHCVCFAPGKLSLRREFLPAFLVGPALLLPRRSGGCARENRR